jgi:hypothetical protein
MVITEDTKKVCEILGIDPDSSDDKVDNAYVAMMAGYASSDYLTKQKLNELSIVYHRVLFHRKARIKNDQSSEQNEAKDTNKDQVVDIVSQSDDQSSDSQSLPSAESAEPLHKVDENVHVELIASPLGLFGRGLLMGVLSVLVIPAPWAAVRFYRWCIENVRLSDKTELSFSGDGSQIWFPMMATMALLLTGQHFFPYLPVLLIPMNCYLGLIIVKWFWRNVVPSCGTKISFVGTYFPLLGWSLLLLISFITIVGWAWVSVGMIRWACRNIQGDNHAVEFLGNGWNVLWRTLVFALSCIVIIPIPWTALWLIKWYMSNVSIQKGIIA